MVIRGGQFNWPRPLMKCYVRSNVDYYRTENKKTAEWIICSEREQLPTVTVKRLDTLFSGLSKCILKVS